MPKKRPIALIEAFFDAVPPPGKSAAAKRTASRSKFNTA
jgi:hypothetical protein